MFILFTIGFCLSMIGLTANMTRLFLVGGIMMFSSLVLSTLKRNGE